MEKYGIAMSVERLSKDQDEGFFITNGDVKYFNNTENILPRTTTTLSIFSNQQVSTLDEELSDDQDEQEEEEEEEEEEEDEEEKREATDSIGAFTTETG